MYKVYFMGWKVMFYSILTKNEFPGFRPCFCKHSLKPWYSTLVLRTQRCFFFFNISTAKNGLEKDVLAKSPWENSLAKLQGRRTQLSEFETFCVAALNIQQRHLILFLLLLFVLCVFIPLIVFSLKNIALLISVLVPLLCEKMGKILLRTLRNRNSPLVLLSL